MDNQGSIELNNKSGNSAGGIAPDLAALAERKPPLEIVKVTKEGVVWLAAPIAGLGLSPGQVAELEAEPCHYLVNAIGYVLVRSQLSVFYKLLADKNYARLCKAHVHKRFAFHKEGGNACFHFHVNLVDKLINRELSREIASAAPDKRKKLTPAQLDALVSEPAKPAAAIVQAKNQPTGGNAMTPMLEIAAQYFKEQDWNFHAVDNKPVLIMGMSGKHGNYNCMAIAREEQQVFIFRTQSAVKAPEEKRAAVAEYLTRANYGLPVGNFEFDYRDGEIAYKTGLDVENDELTPALVRNMVQANLSTFDRYYPGLMEIIYGDTAPEAAVKKIEEK
jgi:hypothetical protein